MNLDANGFGKMLELVRWGGLLTACFIIAGAYLLLRFIAGTVDKLSIRFAERRLFVQKVETFLRFLVYIITAIAVIAVSFRLDTNLLTVMGGTVIVTIGFALKDLAAAVIAGMIILIDKPFQVGDRVAFGGFYGEITAIGLRSVRMQTLDDNTITIPNNQLMTGIASSGNYGALDMQIVTDFYIAADEDVELAQRLVEEAVMASRFIYLKRPVVVLVAQVITEHYFTVRLRVRAYVLDVVYEEEYASDVTKRVLSAFRDHGVKPPSIRGRSEDGFDRAARPARASTASAGSPAPSAAVATTRRERSST